MVNFIVASLIVPAPQWVWAAPPGMVTAKGSGSSVGTGDEELDQELNPQDTYEKQYTQSKFDQDYKIIEKLYPSPQGDLRQYQLLLLREYFYILLRSLYTYELISGGKSLWRVTETLRTSPIFPGLREIGEVMQANLSKHEFDPKQYMSSFLVSSIKLKEMRDQQESNRENLKRIDTLLANGRIKDDVWLRSRQQSLKIEIAALQSRINSIFTAENSHLMLMTKTTVYGKEVFLYEKILMDYHDVTGNDHSIYQHYDKNGKYHVLPNHGGVVEDSQKDWVLDALLDRNWSFIQSQAKEIADGYRAPVLFAWERGAGIERDLRYFMRHENVRRRVLDLIEKPIMSETVQSAQWRIKTFQMLDYKLLQDYDYIHKDEDGNETSGDPRVSPEMLYGGWVISQIGFVAKAPALTGVGAITAATEVVEIQGITTPSAGLLEFVGTGARAATRTSTELGELAATGARTSTRFAVLFGFAVDVGIVIDHLRNQLAFKDAVRFGAFAGLNSYEVSREQESKSYLKLAAIGVGASILMAFWAQWTGGTLKLIKGAPAGVSRTTGTVLTHLRDPSTYTWAAAREWLYANRGSFMNAAVGIGIVATPQKYYVGARTDSWSTIIHNPDKRFNFITSVFTAALLGFARTPLGKKEFLTRFWVATGIITFAGVLNDLHAGKKIDWERRGFDASFAALYALMTAQLQFWPFGDKGKVRIQTRLRASAEATAVIATLITSIIGRKAYAKADEVIMTEDEFIKAVRREQAEAAKHPTQSSVSRRHKKTG